MDHTADRPLFKQLADVLRQKIRDRALAPGDKLPSLHRLAAEYGVSVATVEDALAELRGEGLIESRKGVGSFVLEQADRQTVTVEGPAVVRARMPTPDERRDLGLPAQGVPVLVVEEDGQERVLPANRTRLEIPPR
ncbi:winged helix-turn-helix domain-containing protein [Nonomuraea sp. NPDC047529]|uniref:GntR family transcriptional regulator n=1 Tax=Nonomuraea sp. NPDC047529 TaxID=3155623 RepID=UPI00340CED97